MPTFAFLTAPPFLKKELLRRQNALLPHRPPSKLGVRIHSFGASLNARLLSMPASLDQ
jgi:hypothetical protein